MKAKTKLWVLVKLGSEIKGVVMGPTRAAVDLTGQDPVAFVGFPKVMETSSQAGTQTLQASRRQEVGKPYASSNFYYFVFLSAEFGQVSKYLGNLILLFMCYLTCEKKSGRLKTKRYFSISSFLDLSMTWASANLHWGWGEGASLIWGGNHVGFISESKHRSTVLISSSTLRTAWMTDSEKFLHVLCCLISEGKYSLSSKGRWRVVSPWFYTHHIQGDTLY